MPVDIAQVIDSLKQSRKYKSLCDETLNRVAAWAAARSKNGKEAVKRAKTKLHQVYGAYLGGWDAREAGALLDQLIGGQSEEDVRRICRDMLFMHASMRERMQGLDEIYARIFDVTGRPSRLLDIGCGFQPFALPWMNLPREAKYIGTEIDTRIVDLANRFLARIGQTGEIRAQDVLVSVPTDEVDVVFLFKILPSLEQQEKGCSGRILHEINAARVVVSLPTRTLGGRDVGMDEYYRRMMEEILRGGKWTVTEFAVERELFCILDKRR